MFYFLVSKIPIINNPNDEHNLFKVFVVGTILYLILHVYLFSHPTSNFVNNYGKYLYMIWAGDAGLTGILQKYFLKEDKKEEEKQITLDEIQYNSSPFIKKEEQKIEIEVEQEEKSNKKTSENMSDTEIPFYKSE